MAAKDEKPQETFGSAVEGSQEARMGIGVGTTGSAPDVKEGAVKRFNPFTGTWEDANPAVTDRHNAAVSRPVEE